ncbi:MAG TPA: DUF1501 domain-containing protein [Bryobacteraceae bacterium]|nr:DUF1501 domain-containing protein [Bryobacteraceae bacterium]
MRRNISHQECPGCRAAPPSRREALRLASNGFGLTALSALMADPSYAGLASPRPHFAPKVKNVVFCYMPGGVSHIDTFDPKPKLAELDGKPFDGFYQVGAKKDKNRKWVKSPWQFARHGQSGIFVSELFPHVSTCVDDITVIRSMVSGFPLHPRANLLMHTGRNTGGYPSLGSWVNYALGSENKNLPGYVLLHAGAVPPGGLENFSNGFLPATYQATAMLAEGKPVVNIDAADKDPKIQRAKLDVILQQDRRFLQSAGADDAVDTAIRNYELAYQMQSVVPDVLNLEKESEATRRLYGLDAADKNKQLYGLQCLRARRLIESGVRFVEITCPEVHGGNNGTWDQHNDLKKGHEGNALITDQGVAALLKDLKSRGLSRDTLVVWATEFGRTPHAPKPDGRDHHETAFTVWMAGGGLKSGFVYGATDEVGMHSVQNVTEVYDLHATILQLLGLDHKKLTYRFGGRNVSLTDVHGHVVADILA